jgi:predicted TIM-barrel fold metal-dependent hydrolase
MKTIALEEHFVTASFLQATGAYGNGGHPAIADMRPKLLDLGEERIAAMDEGGIDLQILSLAAMGIDTLDGATATAVLADVNDELAAAIKSHAGRFGGFASLGMKEPEKAAKELERCVKSLGFVGALIDGTTDGLFYDDARFLPVFEAAVSLGVPVYLHPAPPPEPVRRAYFSGLPEEVAFPLSIAGWQWHAELGLHTLRLIVAGLFDRLPDLQLIIGHMGEGIPYALARSSGILSRTAHLKQSVADYFKSNIHITTSGYFTQPPLKCAMEVVGLDRLLYSVDYPFSPNTRGQEFLSTLEGVLTPEQMEQFTHGNAEKLLKIKPV